MDPAHALVGEIIDVIVPEHRLPRYRYGELNGSGSLLVVALRGKARIEVSGQTSRMLPGTVAWIAEAEWLRFTVDVAPWSYLQIRFTAPSLRAPSAPNRVRHLGVRLLPLAAELRRAWETPGSSASRKLRVHGLASLLLGRLLEDAERMPAAADVESSLWWRVETAIRREIGRTYNLADLAAIAGANRVLLERAARAATGLTPIRRLRQIRLLHAQTLMRDSRLLIKEVASAVGYTRIHEFSRDYHKTFGISPRRHRAAGFPPT